MKMGQKSKKRNILFPTSFLCHVVRGAFFPQICTGKIKQRRDTLPLLGGNLPPEELALDFLLSRYGRQLDKMEEH